MFFKKKTVDVRHQKDPRQEIYDAVLPEMARNGIEATDENLLAFLEGLRDSWMEDKNDKNPDRHKYIRAITQEILMLRVKTITKRKVQS